MDKKEELLKMYKQEQDRALNMYLSEYAVSDEEEEKAREMCRTNYENFKKILDTLYDK